MIALAPTLLGCVSTTEERSEPAPFATTAADATALDLNALGLAGVYDNARQYAEAPDSLKKPPAVGRPYDWIDLQHAAFWRVDAPLVGEHVYYLEWRADGPDGPISRQRIWSFAATDARVTMTFYTLDAPEPFAGRGAEPGAFRDLAPARLRGYGPECDLTVRRAGATGWSAVIPDTCVITSRSGAAMRLEAQIALTPSTLSYAEAGVREDGSVVFMVPGGLAYAFDRQD